MEAHRAMTQQQHHCFYRPGMILALTYPNKNDPRGNNWLVLDVRQSISNAHFEWIVDLLAETGEVTSILVPWYTKSQFESYYRVIYESEKT